MYVRSVGVLFEFHSETCVDNVELMVVIKPWFQNQRRESKAVTQLADACA